MTAVHYDHHDKALRDAFAVIRRYDPGTYARMAASDWRVSTHMRRAFPGIGADGYFEMWLASMSGTTAQTMSRRCNGYQGVTGAIAGATWFTAEAAEEAASYMRVPAAYLAASILVHEFAHYDQPCGRPAIVQETPAYAAGAAFARLLPAPYGEQIARAQEDQLASGDIT